MTPKAPRARSGPSGNEAKLLELCKDDRRKLYGLLDADLPGALRRLDARGRRLEIIVAVLAVSVASPRLGGPTAGQLAAAAIHLIFG